jgi:alpha-galactosidase
MAVEAAVHGDLNLLKQAMMMDPLTGAVCNPPEIWQMTDRMVSELATWLPQYQAFVPEINSRLAEEPSLARFKGNKGAARLITRTVEEMEADAEAKKAAAASDKAGLSH